MGDRFDEQALQLTDGFHLAAHGRARLAGIIAAALRSPTPPPITDATPPDDDPDHQCGGPREACCMSGCRECGTPKAAPLTDATIAEEARDLAECLPKYESITRQEMLEWWARSLAARAAADARAEALEEAAGECERGADYPGLDKERVAAQHDKAHAIRALAKEPSRG